MSEPLTIAPEVRRLTVSLLHWTIRDERIRYRSDAYAVAAPSGRVWIDPLPLAEAALAALGRPAAICLTAGQHQRSAWRYRRDHGVPVYAPRGAELDELPDRWISHGELLPAGLRAISAPASHDSDLALLLEDGERVAAAFCGDLVVRESDGPFSLIPDRYVDDPTAPRSTVRTLIDVDPVAVCPAHGSPCLEHGATALRNALAAEGSGAEP